MKVDRGVYLVGSVGNGVAEPMEVAEDGQMYLGGSGGQNAASAYDAMEA